MSAATTDARANTIEALREHYGPALKRMRHDMLVLIGWKRRPNGTEATIDTLTNRELAEWAAYVADKPRFIAEPPVGAA